MAISPLPSGAGSRIRTSVSPNGRPTVPMTFSGVGGLMMMPPLVSVRP